MLRREFIVRLVITAITTTVLIFVIILAIQFWGINPLHHLTGAARAWSQRKFSMQADLSGPEEFRFLSREFNSMARQLERHEHERLSEMEEARHIQANLLPRSVPHIVGLDIEVQYHPAGHVAGDLYDIFCLPGGQVVVAVWDVSGHGIGAALLTGVVKMSLRYHLLSIGNLAQAMKVVNEDLLNCTPEGSFVTACVGLWNSHDQTWQYCAAGHPGGFRLAQGDIETLPATAPLLGVMTQKDWSINQTKLSAGDKVFIYTDGVADIGRTNGHNETQYLSQLIMQTNHLSFTKQVEQVMKETERKREKNAVDDATIVAFEIEPKRKQAIEWTI
jgi:sigma-B regulation protein RsbU (phosphoserine phosphatase)